MQFVTLDEVLAIHDEVLIIAGGRAGIHDFTLLHSAIERPKAQFSGRFLYVSVWLMAAALLQSLVKNHPFEDGNKRTAYASAARFLYKNGHKLKHVLREAVPLMIGVNTGNKTLEEISSWLKKKSRKI